MTENWPSRNPGVLEQIQSERSHAISKERKDPEHWQSLLDPQETTSPNAIKPTYRAQYLQSCQGEYDATCEAYEQIYPHPSDGPRYALDGCREHAFFAMDRVSGNVKVMTDACRQRWCPMCANQKAAFARHSCQAWMESLESPRFLTLTLKHCEDSLLSQVQFLQDCFRRIRMRAYWKKRVFGGIWFLQVHRSASDGCWHPHFHILLEGVYMEQGQISDLWDLVSYGSPVIDIRRIHDPASSAKYVARYSARPAKFAGMSIDDRVEMITALKGKRLSGTFGTAKCVTLTPPKIENDADWIHIGYYDKVVKDAANNPSASLVLQSWRHDAPLSEDEFFEYTGHYFDKVVLKQPSFKPVQYMLDFYDTS